MLSAHPLTTPHFGPGAVVNVECVCLPSRNLDYLQARCAKLETLLRTLDPSIDIDTLLSSPDCNSSDDGDIAAEQYGDGDLEEMLPESENVCGFEWHEREINELSDGMASLNVDSRDVGYLGG